MRVDGIVAPIGAGLRVPPPFLLSQESRGVGLHEGVTVCDEQFVDVYRGWATLGIVSDATWELRSGSAAWMVG